MYSLPVRIRLRSAKRRDDDALGEKMQRMERRKRPTPNIQRPTLNLKNAEFALDKRPIEENCICPACQGFSRGYIRHLVKTEEILGLRLITLHNLRFYLELMNRARAEIERGTFDQFRKTFVADYKTRDAMMIE